MAIVNLLLLAATTFLLSQAYKLYRNYLHARKTGLRVLISPVDPYGIFVQLVINLCGPVFKSLTWARVVDGTWSWEDDDRVHRELGASFVVASPERNLIYTADPVAIEYCLQKRKDFIKPSVFESLNIFGKNVDTVNGEDWSRHRKLTAPCFNERVSGFVWDETLRQSSSMLTNWLSQPSGKISRMVDDTRVVALHVLSAAGFGISHDFLGGARNPAPGHRLSHRDALMTILNHMIASIILAKMEWVNKLMPVLPLHFQKVLVALDEFRLYMDEMLAQERQALTSGQGASKLNLISTLIRTSDGAKAEGINSSVRLSDEEIKGNIFIFNLAGHDTTANTLAYAISLLAVNPDIQEWVREEVDEVLGEEAGLEYEKVFPRLKRVLAVMYETLRLYGPVPMQPRGVASPNTIIHLSPTPSTPSTPNTLIVPPNTELALNVHAAHTTPAIFPSPLSWNPKRWINSSPSSPSLATEKFLPAPIGYAPWSGGPRICPGMKFAQVEFTGVLATVLKGASLAPSGKGGVKVDAETAKKTVMALLRDSTCAGPTLTIKRPEEVLIEVVGR